MSVREGIMLATVALFFIGYFAYTEAAYEQRRKQHAGPNPVIVILASKGLNP